MPKIKLKLTTVLAVLLAIAVIVEIFALYQYGYSNLARRTELEKEAPRQILDIRSYMSLRAWIERNNSYEAPSRQFSTEASGRDNPLLEY